MRSHLTRHKRLTRLCCAPGALHDGGVLAHPGTSRCWHTEQQSFAETAVVADSFMTARELAALIRARTASAREIVSAHLKRINQLNPKINAIVAKLDDDKSLALADAADRRAAKGDPLPPLHGLPIAFKDLQPAVGFPRNIADLHILPLEREGRGPRRNLQFTDAHQ
jgi:hypothetical protein